MYTGETFIFGDINVHFDIPSNPLTSKVLLYIDIFDLEQAVKTTSHKLGHILDWFLHKKDCDSIISVEVSDALTSDHKCVIARLRVSIPPPPPPVYRRTRNLRMIDRLAIRADFSEKLSISTLPHPTADQVDTCLRSVLDDHAPASRRRVASRATTEWYATVAETPSC